MSFADLVDDIPLRPRKPIPSKKYYSPKNTNEFLRSDFVVPLIFFIVTTGALVPLIIYTSKAWEKDDTTNEYINPVSWRIGFTIGIVLVGICFLISIFFLFKWFLNDINKISPEINSPPDLSEDVQIVSPVNQDINFDISSLQQTNKEVAEAEKEVSENPNNLENLKNLEETIKKDIQSAQKVHETTKSVIKDVGNLSLNPDDIIYKKGTKNAAVRMSSLAFRNINKNIGKLRDVEEKIKEKKIEKKEIAKAERDAMFAESLSRSKLSPSIQGEAARDLQDYNSSTSEMERAAKRTKRIVENFENSKDIFERLVNEGISEEVLAKEGISNVKGFSDYKKLSDIDDDPVLKGSLIAASKAQQASGKTGSGKFSPRRQAQQASGKRGFLSRLSPRRQAEQASGKRGFLSRLSPRRQAEQASKSNKNKFS